MKIATVVARILLGLMFTKSFEWSGWVAILATPFLNVSAVTAAALIWDAWVDR